MRDQTWGGSLVNLRLAVMVLTKLDNRISKYSKKKCKVDLTFSSNPWGYAEPKGRAKNSPILVIVGALIVGVVGVYLVSQRNDVDDSMMVWKSKKWCSRSLTKWWMIRLLLLWKVATQNDEWRNLDDEVRELCSSILQTALAQASTGRRVLFFYANWCPTCRPADADFTNHVEKFPQI